MPPPSRHPSSTLAQGLRQPDAFAAVRLGLALWVVVWHCIWLTEGHAGWPVGFSQFVKQGAVDGFFVLSGFFVVGSWLRRPDAKRFVRARAARLLPALWVCLGVTAFVMVPLVTDSTSWRERLSYVALNAVVPTTSPSVGDTPGYALWDTWNVSLWSLPWEMGMYVGVVVLGVCGAVRPRVLLAVAALGWSLMAGLTAIGLWSGTSVMAWQSAAPRLLFAFALGGLFWTFRDRVPISRGLTAVCTVLLVCSWGWDNYAVLAGPALGYLLLVAGVVGGRFRSLRLPDDISYGVYLYGFPVQATLMLSGLLPAGTWPLLIATVLGTVALAWMSWRCVERPVLLRSRAHGAGGAPPEARRRSVGVGAGP